MIGMEKFIMTGLWRLAKNKNNKVKRALHEASVDTFIGAIIMFPLSVIIIKTCIDYFETTSKVAAFANFSLLTVIAIIRKALVRLQFSKYD